MTEYEARFVSAGDLLVYVQPSSKWTEYCLVLGRNYPKLQNMSDNLSGLIFRVLVISKSNTRIEHVSYLWVEKL